MKYTRILILAAALLSIAACTERKVSTVGSDAEIEKRVEQLLSRMTL